MHISVAYTTTVYLKPERPEIDATAPGQRTGGGVEG